MCSLLSSEDLSIDKDFRLEHSLCFALKIDLSRDPGTSESLILMEVFQASSILCSTGCLVLVVSVRCARRGRNHVSIWGKIETSSLYLLFGFFIFPHWIGAVILFGPQNGLNMNGNYDFEECIGFKVKPQKGDGLLFYSLFPNGTIDPVSFASNHHRFRIKFAIVLNNVGVN